MKNILFLLIALTVTFAACKDHNHDDGDYDAAVAIVSPAAGDTVIVGEAVTVSIDFTRPDNKIIHNVIIEILDGGRAVIQTLADVHVHVEGNYNFQNTDFVPSAAGIYILRATTLDDAETPESARSAETTFMAVN